MIGDQPSEDQSEGRVEVCIGGVFGTVCDHYWNEFAAQVVCQKLQQPGIGEKKYFFNLLGCIKWSKILL